MNYYEKRWAVGIYPFFIFFVKNPGALGRPRGRSWAPRGFPGSPGHPEGPWAPLVPVGSAICVWSDSLTFPDVWMFGAKQ